MGSDATVTAGRGVIFIAAAKLYFMVAGYAIYFILPRLFDSPVLWGNYLIVIGLVSVIDNVLVTATIQAVSKFTAQDESQAAAVKRAALIMQIMLAGGLSLAYLLAAPWIARWERDESLTPFFRLTTGIMFSYAFYAVFVGSLNGLKRFAGQATLDMSFSTMRCCLILGAAAAGWGLTGAVGGFVVAAVIILIVSAFWVGLPFGASTISLRPLLRFLYPLLLYTLALNLLMRVDLFLLKRFVGVLSTETDPQAQAAVASSYAAFYGTAQSLAFIPYQAILSVAFVIFPLISRSTFENDYQSTQAYIRQTLRLSLIFVAGVGVVFMSNPEAVIHVVYPAKYRVGGEALRILSLGMVCFSMFTIINTILNGAGRTFKALVVGLVTLALAAGANTLLIPRAGSPENAMVVAALATTGAMAVGMVLSLVVLYREFSAALPPLSILRTVIALALTLLLGHLLPEHSRLVTLAECGLILVAYYGCLVLLREFKSDDLARFRKVLSRRR